MRSAAKKQKKILDLDARNRVTLPTEACEGVDAFAWERMNDGAIMLVPQQVISLEDAKLLRMLKGSIADHKAERVSRIPVQWLEDDESKL